MTTAPPPIRPLTTPGPRPGPAASGAAAGGSTLDPVKLLKQYYPYLVLAVMIGTGLGVAAHFALLNLYPVFTSSVFFECRDPLDQASQAGRRSQSRDEQERFVGTQVNLMSSRLILESALDNRDLRDTTWAKPFVDEKKAIDSNKAIRQLEKDLSARPLPQSNLIQLRVSAHNADDASIIANAVADAFMTDHRRQGNKATKEQKDVLKGRIDKLDASIRSLKAAREGVIKDNQLDASDLGGSKESIALQDISKRVNEINASLESAQSLQNEYQQRLAEGEAEHFPDDLREQAQKDPVLQQYDQKMASLRDSYAALKNQGYGESHPDIVTIKGQMDAVEVERQEQSKVILKRLWAGQVASLQSGLRSLEAQRRKAEADILKWTDRREKILQATTQVDQLTKDIDVMSEQLAKSQADYNELDDLSRRMTENSDAIADRVRIISRAVAPKGVSFPKLQIVVPGVAFLFTGLVGGFLFLREILDQRVRGPSDAAMVPRVKVLGIVPDSAEDPSRPTNVETVVRDNPTGVLTESFRQMRAPLVQTMERSGHKSLVVVGCMPGSGATTVAANLALAVASADERVLVIDANFRRPAMHRLFKLPDGPGLADILAGTTSLDECVHSTTNESLKVLSCGTATARATPERLAGDAMSRVLLEASTRFDMIIVDVPPAVVSGDGYALANKCDAAMIVCRAMQEKRGLLARVRNQLGESRAEFVGVVVNAVRASAGGYFKRNIKATHQYQQNGKA